MKSRTSSPQAEPTIVRRYRVDSPGAGGNTPSPSRRRASRLPSLKFEELPPVMAPSNSYHHEISSAHQQHGPSSPNGHTTATISLLTPLPNGTPRRVSTNENTETPNSPPTTNNARATPIPSSPQPTDQPTPEDSSTPPPWSSAIGHAATSGKSGRVIERLMAENDRLKRELSSQLQRSEELQRNLQTYKPQLETLRAENDNLKHVHGVEESLLGRRDRRIEELKAEVTAERARRESAESRCRVVEAEGAEREEERRRESRRLEEECKHASVHAGILETSHRQLRAEYEQRAVKWRADLEGVEEQRRRDRGRFERLEVVGELMRKELERNRGLTEEVVGVWERYREASEGVLGALREEGERENERVRKLSCEMDRVVGEMRWVMGVEKVRKQGGNGSESVGVGDKT